MLGVLWTTPDDARELAPSVSAPLYPVAGVSAVERAVDALMRAGSDDVLLLSTDHDVRNWGARSDCPVDDVTDDASGVWERATNRHERVLTVNASVLVDPDDLRQVAAKAPAVGVRSTGNEQDEIPPAFAGSPSLFDSARDVSEFAELHSNIPKPTTVALDGALDVRRPWELLAATEAALDDQSRSIDGDVHPDADVQGAVVVEPGATVDAGVVVEGPAYLAAGSSVGPNAYVRGSTFLGPKAHVGHAVEVKNSVLFAGAQVPHLTYVGDSVVGPDANVGAGSLVANLRHDGDDVKVTYGGARVSTNRRKFGAVVGEGAKLGIGTRLNVGVTVGAGATTHPGEVLTRDRGCDAS